MPHRTTYFFPRQFPDRGLESSSKFLLDHEKKIAKENFIGDNDQKESKISKEVRGGGKSSTASVRFSGDRIHGKQLAAFVNWLSEKKAEKANHVKVTLDYGDDDHELLLPQEPPEAVVAIKDRQGSLQRVSSESNYVGRPVTPEVVSASKDRGFDRQASLQRLSSGSSYGATPAVTEVVSVSKDRDIDRQVSLQRLSSGSSYAGSLFSGTTLDGNFSSGVKDSQMSTTMEAEDEEEESSDTAAQKAIESYHLLLTLAKRLTEQASFASEHILLQESGQDAIRLSSDAETVSYRLWVLYYSLHFSHTHSHHVFEGAIGHGREFRP